MDESRTQVLSYLIGMRILLFIYFSINSESTVEAGMIKLFFSFNEAWGILGKYVGYLILIQGLWEACHLPFTMHNFYGRKLMPSLQMRFMRKLLWLLKYLHKLWSGYVMQIPHIEQRSSSLVSIMDISPLTLRS